MPDYRVIWEIDIVAGNQLLAAKLAREIQLDPENRADHFIVVDSKGRVMQINTLEPANERYVDPLDEGDNLGESPDY